MLGGGSAYLVLDVVEGFDVLPVELLWGHGAHTVEVLVLVSVLPADRLGGAAQTHTGHPEHLENTHTHTRQRGLVNI